MKDKYFPLDYPRTYLNFLQEAQNLKNFVTSRYSSALAQLDPQENTDVVPAPSPPSDETFVIVLTTVISVVVVGGIIGVVVILKR